MLATANTEGRRGVGRRVGVGAAEGRSGESRSFREVGGVAVVQVVVGTAAATGEDAADLPTETREACGCVVVGTL